MIVTKVTVIGRGYSKWDKYPRWYKLASENAKAR